MRQIYNGLHEKVFPRYIAYLADQSKDSKKQKIILDWPELATDSYINLLLGEEPEIVAGNRDDLPTLPTDQAFIDVSRYGIGLFEVSDDGVQALNPENCYIVVTPGNIQLPQAFVFFHIWKEKESQSGKEKEIEYIKFTVHQPGKIRHLIFLISPGAGLTKSEKKLSGPLPIGDFPAYSDLEVDADGYQYPPVEDMLVVAIQNKLSSERYYGQSDYKPSIISLIESLELLFAQRAEVLAKFTSPTPVVPESATVFDHSKEEWVYKPGQAIITKPGDPSPSLMVWQAELGAVDRAIEQSMDQLLQMLQLSRVLLAGQGQGTAESGSALRIRLIPTLSKVSKYARAAEKAIPAVLHLWSQLHLPEIPIEEIEVKLKDGIPDDPMEEANVNNIRATALATLKTVGIIGRRGALQMAFDSGLLKPLPGLDVEQSIDQLLSESLDEMI
ncbi:MAG: Phage portal protein, SPP1 Gp6-like [Methanosaeta sp. PtaB.Bin039]|nr:MAG: Phage portal protein, SPP1 Gp6-like [Methanosaeta sp. PtaB.Bin039]